jgi:pimeloyl-ACP methyl ester carboxylesterase
MPAYNREGIQFHYRDEGAGLPFVFQHGLGGDAGQPFEFFEHLLRDCPPFRLITLDCRAHGRTQPVGPEDALTISRLADDVVDVMDRLGLSQAVVGGISMGAAIALNIALRYPARLRGLVLSRPAWLDRPDPENLSVLKLVATLIRMHGAQEGREHFLKTTEYASIMDQSPDVAQSLLGQFEHPRAVETVAKLERIPMDAPCRDRSGWASIAVPTLVLANRQDPVHPFEYGETLAAAIPGAEFCEITPKSVSIDNHERDVCESILNFFSRRIEN